MLARRQRKTPAAAPPSGQASHAAATAEGDVVLVFCGQHHRRHSPQSYAKWRHVSKGVTLVVAEEGFAHDKDVVFECTLDPVQRMYDSWMGSHLGAWVWRTQKTGLLTPYERVEALLLYMFTDGPWRLTDRAPPRKEKKMETKINNQ